MEVIFIRHTSVDVPPGVCYGQTDVPLRNSFEQEAAVTSGNLKSYERERFRLCIYQSAIPLCTSCYLLRIS